MSLSVIKNIICQLGIAESAKAIILENALNKISEAVLTSIDKAKSDKAFKELFGSLKEKVIVNEQFKNVNDELTNIFYSPEFDELCKIKRIGNEYDYIDAVREYLVSILDKYDIKYNLQDKIIEQFVTELLEEIKHKDEDLYKKICDSELYKDSRKFNRRVYKTIDDYDNDLKVNTKITTGLDFFVIDDVKFVDDFMECVCNEEIYISCQNVEEGFYLILNLLKNKGMENKVRIIDNIEIWSDIQKINQNGLIYIPKFNSNRINRIQGNTCIFIIEKQVEALLNHNALVLERRLNKNIVDALIKTNNYESEDAYKLVIDNHGLFNPIFHELKQGKDIYTPKWSKDLDNNVLCICAMIGQWVNCDGDKDFIRKLYGDEYDQFKLTIANSINGSDPLFLEYDFYEIKKYVLASRDILYSIINIDFDSNLWQRFEDLCNDCISKYYVDNRISKELFEGVLNFLNYFINIRSEYHIKLLVKNVIEKIFSNISNDNDWERIAESLSLMVEICPNEIIGILNEEIDNKKSFINLFKKQDRLLFGVNAYVNVLWAIEVLLIQKEYCIDAFKLLVKIYRISEKLPSNSPKDIIEKSLCIGFNYSAINTIGEKKVAASFLVENCDDGWGILLEQIALYQGGMVINICKPKYKEYEQQSRPTREDVQKLYQIYFDILISTAESNACKLAKFLERKIFLIAENNIKIKDAVRKLIKNGIDRDKLTLELEIRKFIHDNRMHASAEWSISEEELLDWECIVNSVKYSKEEYHYLYLFLLPDLEINLYPKSFDEKDWYEKGIEESDSIVEKSLGEFKTKGLNIKLLIEYLSQYDVKKNDVGRHIAMYYSKGTYDKNVMYILYNANYEYAVEYISFIEPYCADIIKDVVDDDRFVDDFKMGVYKIDYIRNEEPLILNNKDEHFLKKFWNSDIGIKKEFINWQINQLVKYDSVSSFIRAIYVSIENKLLDADNCFNYFIKILNMSTTNLKSISMFELEKILENFEKLYINNDKAIYELAKIELKLYPILYDKELRSLKQQFSKDAGLYAQLCSFIYKDDNNSVNNLSNEQMSFYYKLYLRLKFKIGINLDKQYDKVLMKRWINDLKDELKKMNHMNIIDIVLGKVIGFNICLSDINDNIIDVIEENGSDIFIREIANELFNSIGARWIGDGSDWLDKEKDYLRKQEDMNNKGFVWTSKLYGILANDCKSSYIEERKMLQRMK